MKNMVKTVVIFLFFPILLLARDFSVLDEIEFSGNKTFTDEQLKDKLSQHPPSFVQGLLFWQQPDPFSKNILRQDIQTLIRFYQTEGFLNIKITSTQTIEQNSVHVLLNINEGEPVSIDTVKFHLVLSDTSLIDYKQKLIKAAKPSLRLQTGERFRDQNLRQDMRMVTEHFLENGFPLITVEGNTRLNNNRVDVTLTINSGPLCVFSETSIKGNNRIVSERIKKQLTFSPGDTVQQSLIESSQRKIYQLDVFQYASVNLEFEKRDGQKLPVTIMVEETAKMTTKIGLGYGREDKFRAFLDLQRIGFFGDVRQLHFLAKHSYLEPYHFNVRWIHPAFIRDIEFSINPFYRRQREPSFSIDRAGANLMLQKQFGIGTDVYLQYTLEQDNLDINQITREEALSKSDITLYNKSSVTLGFLRNTADSPFMPTSGSFFALTSTLAGLGFESDFHFIRFIGEYRRYFQMNASLVYAVRSKAGFMKSIRTDENTPIEERFYSGGSHSIRGWARSQLGPGTSQGKPIGGHNLFEFNNEFRIPVWKKLSGVVFLDIGNVWKKVNSFQFASLRYAAGFGLRYQLPIGPVRIDLGFPVADDKKTPEIHFSVGQAF